MNIYPEATQLYVDDPASNINTDSSRLTYRQTLRNFAYHVDKPLAAVIETDLVDFVGRDLSPGTRQAYITRLQGLFRWALWKGLIEVDPSVHLKRIIRDASHSKPVREHNWLTEGQVFALYDTIDLTKIMDRRDNIVLRLGFSVGLRVNELRSLTWDKVDLAGQSIRFTGKGRKLASVAITDTILPHLTAWRDEYQDGHGPLRDAPVVVPCANRATFGEGERISLALWGQRLTTRSLHQITVRRSEMVGFQFRPHDMRRSLAGLLEDAGATTEDISAALRHSNLGTTQRYLEKRQDAAVQAVRKANLRV